MILGAAIAFPQPEGSIVNSAGDSWNGAAKWMSEHKAEIVVGVGVGVAALAAATIVTGGAALAVAGTGVAVSAGTVATVVTGGVVAGAGLNLSPAKSAD